MKIPFSPYGYVYCITNTVNGKNYIGKRKLSLDKFWRQYLGSGTLIKNAVNKYGKETFIKSFLGYAFSEKDLEELEWYWIQEFKRIGKAEYNLFNGKGAGGDTFSKMKEKNLEEVRQKISEGLKNSKKKNSAIEKRKKYFLLTREKIKEDNKEKILLLYSNIQSIKKVSNELNITNRIVKEVLTENLVPLNVRVVKGVKHNEETKTKISKKILEIIPKNENISNLNSVLESGNLDKLIEMIQDPKLSYSEIAKKLSVDRHYLLLILKEYNLYFKKRRLTESFIAALENQDLILKMYNEGSSLREIGRKVNLHHGVISNLLNYLGNF